MTRLRMGLRVGTLVVVLPLLFSPACEDKEKSAVIGIGVGPDGGRADVPGVMRGRLDGAAPTDSGAGGGILEVPAAADAAVDITPPPVDTAPVPDIPSNPLGNYTGKPWNGTVAQIPGIVEMELYDVGGEGVAFHDTDTQNRGNGLANANMTSPEAMFRRAEPVDLSFTMSNTDRNPMGMNEPPNQLYVGWVVAGEWLKFTVNVAETGNYMISSHCAVNAENTTVSFSFEDGVTTPALPVPRSGNWTTWHHVDNMIIIRLTAGLHVMTVKFDTAGANYNYFSFVRKP